MKRLRETEKHERKRKMISPNQAKTCSATTVVVARKEGVKTLPNRSPFVARITQTEVFTACVEARRKHSWMS
jgi:hypothetical protein